MSSAHFNGIFSPVITSNNIILGQNNFLTYRVTDTSANVIIPSGEGMTVRSFVPPQGYWSWSMNFALSDVSGQDITSLFLQAGNELPFPSDKNGELVAQSTYKSVVSSPLISDTINGICYSDGSANFSVYVAPITISGESAIWASYENASIAFGVYPSIQFAKLG
jgi:hypothetical protein